jgi:hypothetical protein
MAKKITKSAKADASGPTPITGIRIQTDLKDFLNNKAEEDGRTFSGLVLKILSDWAKTNGWQ